MHLLPSLERVREMKNKTFAVFLFYLREDE